MSARIGGIVAHGPTDVRENHISAATANLDTQKPEVARVGPCDRLNNPAIELRTAAGHHQLMEAEVTLRLGFGDQARQVVAAQFLDEHLKLAHAVAEVEAASHGSGQRFTNRA